MQEGENYSMGVWDSELLPCKLYKTWRWL